MINHNHNDYTNITVTVIIIISSSSSSNNNIAIVQQGAAHDVQRDPPPAAEQPRQQGAAAQGWDIILYRERDVYRCVCIYIYIYTTGTPTERDTWCQHSWGRCRSLMFCDRGTCWVLPLT